MESEEEKLKRKADAALTLFVATTYAIISRRPVGQFAAGIQFGLRQAFDLAAANGVDLEAIYDAGVSKFNISGVGFADVLPEDFARLVDLFKRSNEAASNLRENKAPVLIPIEVHKMLKLLEDLTGGN